MSMEDVVLVARVREEIRGGALRVNPADIRRHIEVVQAGKLRHLMGDDIHRDAPKKEATAQKSDSMVSSAVDPNVDAAIAEMTGVVLPPGLQHKGTKEGGTSKEHPVESPGVELPGAVESTPQDYLKKNVATSTVQSGGTRKLEVALPKASPMATAFAENPALRAMAQEVEEKANAETLRRLEAEAAKEHADAEEKARKVQEEAVRARERAFAEAKKAAVEAGAKVKYEAESRAKVEAAVNANEEVMIKAVEGKAATAKAEEERKRVEAFKVTKAESCAKQVMEQRAVDRAARAAAAASGAMASDRGDNEGGRLSKTSQAALEAVWGIPTEGPAPPVSTSLWDSDSRSKRPKNAPSPNRTDLGRGTPIQHPSIASSTPRGSAPTRSMTSITAAPSSASVVSSPTLVWQERKPINDKQDDKAGDSRATAALPAEAAADVPSEAKSETVMAIADKPVPSQTTNASKTCDIVGGTTAPNVLGDKYASPAPTPCTYRSMRGQETAPAELVADLKPDKAPTTSVPPLKPCQPGLLPGSLPLPTPRQPGLVPGGFPLPSPRPFGLVPGDFPPQTPRQSHLFLSKIPPETDAAVTREHVPSPEPVASASAKRNGEPETPNVRDAKNAGETSAQTAALFAAAQDIGVKPDGAATEPIPRLSLHSEAGGWRPPVTKGGDANPEGPMKPPRFDYIREVSTASTVSASSPGMPVDDAASSSLDKDEDFDSRAKLSRAQKKRIRERARKQQQQKVERNSPRLPSGATMNSVDNSVVQEPESVLTVPLGTYSDREGRRCPCGCEAESGEDDMPGEA
ncbi:hypothetical protein EDB86DRAFT_697167 [Lactarius hatsudake]|nr:hypothetical protein EDB86DRAFT_697167 [Lactarius hatsudake]